VVAVVDIKDRAPNAETVAMLERLLAKAKDGELRTVIMICGYDDDCWYHSWSMDHRSSKRRMLGEFSLTQYDMLTNVALMDGDTIIANAL
jgi:hypothetical protein